MIQQRAIAGLDPAETAPSGTFDAWKMVALAAAKPGKRQSKRL